MISSATCIPSDFHSFFEDKSKTETWTKCTQIREAQLEETFTVVSTRTGDAKVRTLRLSGHWLLKNSTKGLFQLELRNARLETMQHPKLGQGLKLTKNSFKIEFYGNVGHWFTALKKHCIQSNFTQAYQVLKQIGKGNFARVYKVRSKKTQVEWAAKAFDKTMFMNISIDKPALIKELELLRQMEHKGVITVEEVFESEQFIFVVQEYLEGGELYEFLKKQKPFTEENASKMIYGILDAVCYIHSKGLLHRDLKPENLILRHKGSIEEVVIADFGLADYYRSDGGYLFTRCGTPGYVAPELLQDKLYDQKVDVYSIGILLYILLAGQSPFKAQQYDDVVMLNYKGQIDFSELKLTKEGIDCLKGMLEANPHKRYTAVQARAHPWFKKHNRKSDILITKRIIKLQERPSNETTPTTQSHSLTQFDTLNSPLAHTGRLERLNQTPVMKQEKKLSLNKQGSSNGQKQGRVFFQNPLNSPMLPKLAKESRNTFRQFQTDF